MKLGRAGEAYLVRLEVGDDILASVEALCRDHAIANAELTGLGSVNSPTLAHYRMDTQHFTERAFEGIYEIISLVGNVSLVDDAPKAHCHVTIGDEAMTVHGGHLVRGVCSATLELMVRPLPSHFVKQLDETIGLQVWQLDESPRKR